MLNINFQTLVKRLGILFIISGISIWAGYQYRHQFTPKPAPTLLLTTISGKMISLPNTAKQPLILTFWSSNCPSCIKEIPILTQFYRQFHPSGLQIVAIAMNYDPPNRVVELANQYTIPYDIVLDLRGDYAQAFGEINAVPLTLLINPAGQIIWQQLGLFNPNQLQQQFFPFLKPL